MGGLTRWSGFLLGAVCLAAILCADCGDGWEGGLPPVAKNPGRVPTFDEPRPTGQRALGVALELDETRQEWLGCGVTAHYHTQFPYALQGGVQGSENPLLDLFFGSEGLGCRLLVIRAVAEDNADPWPPLVFTGGNLKDGGFVLDDPPAASMLTYLRDRQVEVALRPERAPPLWVTSGPDLDPNGEPVVRLAAGHAGDYAGYLADYLVALGEIQSRPLWGLIPQNEPDFPTWWAYMLFAPDRLEGFVRDDLRPALDKAGLSETTLLGPDVATTWALPTGTNPGYFTTDLIQACGVLDFHAYDIPFNDPDDDAALERLSQGVARLPADRPVLIEYGNATGRAEDEALGGTPEEMILAARHLMNLLDRGRASRILWWQGFWDNPAAGLIQLDADPGGWEVYAVPLDYQLTPKYFALQHFFRFAPAGSRLVMGPPAVAGVGLLAFEGPGEGQLTVVVVHAGSEQVQLGITLRGVTLPDPPGPVRHFRSTYKERFEEQPAPDTSTGGVSISIPPCSLHTLVWETP